MTLLPIFSSSNISARMKALKKPTLETDEMGICFNGKFVTATPKSVRFSSLGKASTNPRLQLTVSLFAVTPAFFKQQRLVVKQNCF